MANSVTCRPEIATRCVVPVALNTRHWSVLMPIGESHGQRGDQSRGIGIGDALADASRDPRAQRVDGIVRQCQPRVERRRQDARAEVDAVPKGHALRIESVKVVRGAGMTQARQQPPAFADARRNFRVAPAQPRAAWRVAGAGPDDDAHLGIETQLRAISRRNRGDFTLEQYPRIGRRRRAVTTPASNPPPARRATSRPAATPAGAPRALRATESAACPPRRCLRTTTRLRLAAVWKPGPPVRRPAVRARRSCGAGC